MPELFAYATVLTFLFTRASIVRHTLHLWILRVIPAADEFIQCYVCVGWWCVLIVGLLLRATPFQMCGAYLGLLLFCALFDRLALDTRDGDG